MADDRLVQVVNAAMTRFFVRQVDKCVRLEAYGFVGEATPARTLTGAARQHGRRLRRVSLARIVRRLTSRLSPESAMTDIARYLWRQPLNNRHVWAWLGSDPTCV